MTLERAQELMLDALVQELGGDDLEELRAHLAAHEPSAEQAAKYDRLWANLESVAIPKLPDAAEDRLMTAVEKEFGSLKMHTEPTRRRTIWQVAAALLLVAVGSMLTVGTQKLLDHSAATPTAGKSRYMLIMTEMDEASRVSDQAQAEFSAWINDLVRRGVMETGIGLADLPAVGTPPDGNLLDPTVSGVIVVLAEDAQEARQIAVSSPVITYGGFIEIRELSGNRSEE